jgi:uncharacterized protein involved in tolerance to divalent cations
MSQLLDSRQSDLISAGVEAATAKIVERLGKISKYENPKIVSFPIDGMRVTSPLSASGNSY